MISTLYIVLATLLLGYLAFKVIQLRRKHQVSLGDGGITALQSAIAAHANAVENLPIGLLLLLTLEFNHTNIVIVHLFGVLLISSRLIHANAMLNENLKRRVLGMQFTFYTLIALLIANIIMLPFDKIMNI